MSTTVSTSNSRSRSTEATACLLYTSNFAFAFASMATLFGATQASAAEPFNGPYVGVEAGWQQDRLRAEVRPGTGGALTGTDTTSGFAYGGQIGYDFKLAENFVLGAEAFATGDSSRIDGIGGLSADGGRAFGLAARAGVLAGPTTLVYLKGCLLYTSRCV